MSSSIALFLVCSNLLNAVAIFWIIFFMSKEYKEPAKFAIWAYDNGFYYNRETHKWVCAYHARDENDKLITYTTAELIKLWKKG